MLIPALRGYKMPGHQKMEQKRQCYQQVPPGEEQETFYSAERTNHTGNVQAKAVVPGAI